MVADAPKSSTGKVIRADVAETREAERQHTDNRPRLLCQRGLAVRGVLDALTDIPRAAAHRHLLGAEEDRDRVVVGPDENGLADELRPHGGS